MKTVREIVKDWLVLNDYDGLYNDDCGCQLSDLMPCDSFDGCISNCKPGYKVDAHEDDPEGYDFYIMSSKANVEDYKESF